MSAEIDLLSETTMSGSALVEAPMKGRGLSPIPFVDLSVEKPTQEALGLADGDFVLKHQILPIRLEGETLVAAIGTESALSVADTFAVTLERPVRAVLADPSLIRSFIEERFIENMLSGLPGEDGAFESYDEADLADLQKMAGETAVVQMVNLIFSQAVRDNASDIHIEPYDRELRVRCRLDGMLQEVAKPPKRMHAALISRLKILGGMNIAERRLPQDGRIKLTVAGRSIDVRVAIVPTIYGERAVMRILDKSSAVYGLQEVGMPAGMLDTFRRIIRQPHGMILSTGPTGSGKSTTLYGALQELTSLTTNILTIEDPVEYQIFGIGQIQVQPNIGLTFAKGLRSIVRQDPDILMVGEIRDQETADIAIHAALTGHLIFSTLHTNDSPGAISRLLDMGVEPYLAASSLIAILAQRLVRKNCQQCSEPVSEMDPAYLAVGIKDEDLLTGRVRKGRGCEKCQGTGYKGRSGVFELLTVDDQIRDLTNARASSNDIKKYATEKQGMKTLFENARDAVLAGITTPEEVLRVCEQEDI